MKSIEGGGEHEMNEDVREHLMVSALLFLVFVAFIGILLKLTL